MIDKTIDRKRKEERKTERKKGRLITNEMIDIDQREIYGKADGKIYIIPIADPLPALRNLLINVIQSNLKQIVRKIK